VVEEARRILENTKEVGKASKHGTKNG